jgi:hypothetical protein
MRLAFGQWSERYGIVLVAFLLGLTLTGCGEKPREAIPKADLEAAITRYLTERGFEMRPTTALMIVEGPDGARATWKLKHADSDLGLAVTWEFRFEKKNDAWSVINHAQK